VGRGSRGAIAARTSAFLASRREQGVSFAELASELRVPPGEIKRALSDHGRGEPETAPPAPPTRGARVPRDPTPKRPAGPRPDKESTLQQPRRQPPAPEFLRQRYVDDGRSARAIGQEIGWCETRILVFLRDAGIPTRPPGSVKGPRRLTLDQLVDLINRGFDVMGISAETGASPAVVRSTLAHFELAAPRQKRYPELTRERLLDLYVVQGWAAEEIAAEVGCHISTVYRALGACGIPRHRPQASRRRAMGINS